MDFGPMANVRGRGVGYIREEVRFFLHHYTIIRDCLAGAKKVKEGRTKYLRKPNFSNNAKENEERYFDYLNGALFYNATRRTLGGMVGEVFARDPVCEIPDELDFLNKDATGTGVPLVQLAKRGLGRTLSYGRAGVFVDYPETDGAVSLADKEEMGLRPSISVHNSWDIPNWRTDVRGSKEVLTMVVIQEPYIASDDGFEVKTGSQYRVLRLRDASGGISADGDYTIEIWRRPGSSNASQPVVYSKERFVLVNGERTNNIAFRFVGSESNDFSIDHPPLYDLADTNIAHFRNSADYEDSIYQVGQPTLWLAGMTKQWMQEVYPDKKVRLGARGGIFLPAQGSAGILQVEPNTMAFEGMNHKERLMVALGAEIVQAREVQRTATEAGQEKAAKSSVLSTTADNVSDVMTWAINYAGDFEGITPSKDTAFKLNTEFDLINMTPQQVQQVVASWQSGAISFSEMRENFRRGGIATLDDADAQAEIGEELAETTAREVEVAGAMAKVVADAQPPAPAPKAK
jgi:hypothetical protein